MSKRKAQSESDGGGDEHKRLRWTLERMARLRIQEEKELRRQEEPQELEDVRMRGTSAYDKDAHTIYVETLDDSSDEDEREPKFTTLVDIDKALSRIPAAVLGANRTEEIKDLILYRPQEQIVREAIKREERQGAKEVEEQDMYDADAMEIE